MARCGVCFEDADPGMLTCDACLVNVHPECYGACGGSQRAGLGRSHTPPRWATGLLESETPLDQKASWLCRRCVCRPLRGEPGACALCPHRGGALSPIGGGADKGWCHVLCVLWTNEAMFDNPERLCPVSHASVKSALDARK